jgi:hypothetical protein
MPVPTDPFNFTNGTTADADQVDARFAALYATLAGGLDLTNLAVSLKNGLLKLATIADRKIAFGQVPAFDWSGTDETVVVVTHGLGVTPVLVLAGGGGGGSAGDARYPWVTSAHGPGATTFSVSMATRNNDVIGVFAVPTHQRPYWVAIG